MPGRVTPVVFTVDMLGWTSVQGFGCGDEAWEREITEWLKAPLGSGGAVDETFEGNTTWLYVSDDGDVVGVASVGPSSASWPKNSSPRLPATCVTWVATDYRHRGKGYGGQIMNHVVGECLARKDDFPLVVLYVYQGNPARDWYVKKYNFAEIGKPLTQNGRFYDRLVLSLV